ncbi:MAG: ABC transporter permease [Planctomycetota bacterium]
MRKILTIAAREYKAMVGTKAFLISIIMMPVLMLGSLLAMELLQNNGEITDRKIAVIDHSGAFVDPIQASAEKLAEQMEILLQQNDGQMPKQGFGQFSKDRYVIEVISSKDIDDQFRLLLSNRIREQDLYAFVEIPASIVDSEPSLNEGEINPNEVVNVEGAEKAESSEIRFYSQGASLADARGWIAQIINSELKRRRLEAADIDPVAVANASSPVDVVGMALVEKSADGSISVEKGNDPLTAIFLPMGVMMLMFMVIFMAAQPMLESVLEEKSQRIAEVLLGSANSFQLMSGKLLGTVAGSLTVFAIYLGGMYAFASYKGFTDQIPFEIAPWFILFQVMGVLFYAAIFLAIGASVSQLKEAQSMLLPVWMLMMSPMFVWLILVRDPLGSTAVYFSMFPPAAPTAMMLRMATGQAIPIWQPLVSAALTLVSTIVIVYVAARIFRVGILWQGKTPKLTEIVRWAFKG